MNVPLASNAQIAEFYDRQSERFGPSGILPHHEARATRLARLTGTAPLRVLELGSGAGGTAVATARLGHSVVAVELSPVRARYGRELSAEQGALDLRIVEGDFYTAELGRDFDVVAYWNGFGMGSDDDQRRLLRRVASEWSRPAGVMLVDVFNPTWWARLSGAPKEHPEIGAVQRTIFDPVGSRFVDRWTAIATGGDTIEQSIRCYSPADLRLLVQDTGLEVARLEVEDATDLSRLDDAYSYLAVLRRSD